jgi:hypothetical protein
MTCRSRSFRSGVAIVASLVAFPAAAAELPPIKSSESNRVPECATPGRLISYVRERNPKLDTRYDGLAADYMRHGEALHVRWDYAFFQMLLETGYLTYKGDVKPEQNNFAGLGATGRGARGESFKDISTGVQAHIEHLVMYSGERVESPVAERTRNIQEWGVLTSWQQGLSGPITFSQMAKKWAPGSRRYVSDIDTIANRFFDGLCKQPDSQAEVVAAVGGPDTTTKAESANSESAAKADTPPMTRGLEAQKRALEAAKAEGGGSIRTALGATPPADEKPAKADTPAVTAEASAAAQPATQNAATTPPITLLNGEPPKAEASAETVAKLPADQKEKIPAEKKAAPEKAKSIEVAALPGAVKNAGKVEKPAAGGKCRVWTASYGGAKAIIIKAVVDATVNYTVLDVNDGAEKREADAYINAYAKGGQSIGEFTTQSQALEKAFELCPEG